MKTQEETHINDLLRDFYRESKNCTKPPTPEISKASYMIHRKANNFGVDTKRYKAFNDYNDKYKLTMLQQIEGVFSYR